MAQSLRPLATVGTAARRPTSIRRSPARPLSSPPSRSSSVALMNAPMTTSVSTGCSAWPSHVPDSASRGTPAGTALLTAPASLSAAPSSASSDSSASTALLAAFSPRVIATSQIRASHLPEFVGEEDESVTDGLGVDEAHGPRGAGLVEQALAGPEHDGEDDQTQFV